MPVREGGWNGNYISFLSKELDLRMKIFLLYSRISVYLCWDLSIFWFTFYSLPIFPSLCSYWRKLKKKLSKGIHRRFLNMKIVKMYLNDKSNVCKNLIYPGKFFHPVGSTYNHFYSRTNTFHDYCSNSVDNHVCLLCIRFDLVTREIYYTLFRTLQLLLGLLNQKKNKKAKGQNPYLSGISHKIII